MKLRVATYTILPFSILFIGCVGDYLFTGIGVSPSLHQPIIVSSTTSLPLTTPASNPMVCNPFGGGEANATGNPHNGLQASLTYIPAESPLTANGGQGLTINSFSSGSPDVVLEPTPIIFNQLNVPTVDFSVGFQNSAGATLTDSLGKTLNQYFSLHLDSLLMLNPGEVEGDYQLGLLSDDGAILSLSLNGSGGLQDWINNDGTHQNQLGCAAQTVHLKPSVPIPVHIDYFQGPLYRIGLILLWRFNPGSLYESLCGKDEHDQFYFRPTVNNPSLPTSNFQGLLNRGWSIVPASNFYLPSGTNNCNN